MPGLIPVPKGDPSQYYLNEETKTWVPIGLFVPPLGDSSKYFLCGDGTWREIDPPIVEYHEIHLDNEGEY